MNSLPRGLVFIFVIIVLLPAAFAMMFERVHPMTIGVRQSRWGGGIEDLDFDAGFHLGVSGVHKWYLLPRATHFLHFKGARSSESRSGLTMFEPSLELRTKDNNITSLDVTVPYTIQANEAWEIVSDAQYGTYRDLVKNTVLSVLRSQLSELSSEDLQSTELRLVRVADVLPILNEKLAENHVVATDILFRRVAFPASYEEKLQAKQFLTQKRELDRAEAAQAREEQATNSIEKKIKASELTKTQDWEKTLQEERSRYEVLVAEIAASARVYEAQVTAAADADAVTLKAEGQLAVDRAEALRNQLRNEILNSRGGNIFLALEAAENLNMPSVTLNSNDPRVPIVLDLDEMTRLLIGEGGDP